MSFRFVRAPPARGPQGVTLGAGRHPSPLSRRPSVLIRMEAGPAVQPGERRGGEVGRFLARLQSASAVPSGFGAMRAGRSSATQTRCVPGRADVRKPLTARLLRMRPTTLMQLPVTRLCELWPAA